MGHILVERLAVGYNQFAVAMRKEAEQGFLEQSVERQLVAARVLAVQQARAAVPGSVVQLVQVVVLALAARPPRVAVPGLAVQPAQVFDFVTIVRS